MSNKLTFKKVFGQIYIWLILLLMYLPILLLIAYSFTTSTNIGGWSGFSFDLYSALFKNEEIMVALGNTLLLAIISAAVATLLGTIGAIGAFYSKKRVRNAIDGMTQIPLVSAEIVMAFSLTILFVFLGTKVFGGERLKSFWTLLIGHVLISVPFVYTSVKPKLEQMDPSLYEAALDLGCTPRRAMSKVMIPEIMPGIFSGFLLSITLSLDDYVVTAFTRGPGLLSGEGEIETLSTLIQSKIVRGPVPPEMRALTTIIFIVVVVAVILITIYKNKTSGKKKLRKGRQY